MTEPPTSPRTPIRAYRWRQALPKRSARSWLRTDFEITCILSIRSRLLNLRNLELSPRKRRTVGGDFVFMRGQTTEPALRAISMLLAAVVVIGLLAAALFAKIRGRLESYRDPAIRVTLSLPLSAVRQLRRPHQLARAANATARSVVSDSSAEVEAAMLAGLANALRCATAASRRTNAEACPEGPSWGPAPRQAIPLQAVEGVYTKDGQSARTIARAATLAGRILLNGEAQRYAAPGEDTAPQPLIGRKF